MEFRLKSLDILLREALDKEQKNEALVQEFLNPLNKLKRYVIGDNAESSQLINHFNIEGLINDFSNESHTSSGLPILKSSDVSGDAIVVNCSSSISPVSTFNAMKDTGIPVLNVIDIINASNGLLELPWFVDEFRKDYAENKGEYSDIFSMLSDEESKQTFIDVVGYRLSANIDYMKNYKVRLTDQYFESFMNYHGETFVDAGGYDGDTTEEFIKRYPDYKKVFLFEPSEINIRKAKKRLKGYRDIEYLPIGLSDKCETLQFDPAAGSSSSISETATSTIEVKPLDTVLKEPVSFIKMDLEGWEMKALEGCRQHIIDEKPKLAIAVYHKASDFRDVPRMICNLNSDYKVYLRHYTQGWSETVMFFV